MLGKMSTFSGYLGILGAEAENDSQAIPAPVRPNCL